MAITITAYTFSKRSNSTKQPDVSGTEFSVSLKAATSYENPTFILNYSGTFAYNYMQWGSWYYFVTSVTQLRNDLLEINCKLDVLATFKTEIGATSAFVLYDTAANTEIIDRRLSTKTTKTVTSAVGTFSTIGTVGLDGPIVVMGITSIGYGHMFYAMTREQAYRLLADINLWLNNANFLPIPDVTDWTDQLEVFKTVGYNVTLFFRQFFATGKAADNVKSAFQIPIPLSSLPGYSTTVKLGDYETSVTATMLTGKRTVSDSCTVAIPWQFTDWRNNDPYTEIYVYLPYIGLVSYPASALVGCASLDVLAELDLYTGDAIFRVQGNDAAIGRPLGKYGCNLGGAYAVGSSNINTAAIGTSIAGALGAGAAAIATGGIGAAAAVGAAGINGMIASGNKLSSAVITGGGGANMYDVASVQVYVVTHDTNVSPDSVSATIGTPSMAVKQIGTLSGYVQTQAASVAASCDETTRAEINALLDGGIYYE